jgi:hypothetical protein
MKGRQKKELKKLKKKMVARNAWSEVKENAKEKKTPRPKHK